MKGMGRSLNKTSLSLSLSLSHRKRLCRPLQNPQPEDGGEAVSERGARGHSGPDEARDDGGRLAADDVHRTTRDEAKGAKQQREAEGRQ